MVLFTFSFDPRDIWIGVYWNRVVEKECSALYIYVCIIPMLPVRVAVYS